MTAQVHPHEVSTPAGPSNGVLRTEAWARYKVRENREGLPEATTASDRGRASDVPAPPRIRGYLYHCNRGVTRFGTSRRDCLASRASLISSKVHEAHASK